MLDEMKGKDAWPVRRTIMAGAASVALLFGGFFGWAAWANISGAVVASGQVEVESRRQVVQHPDGGVVSAILASDGRFVNAGDVLISLDGSALLSEKAIVDGQYFEVLSRRGRLEAERMGASEISFPKGVADEAEASDEVASMMEGQRELFRARAETLDASIRQMERQSDQIEAAVVGMRAQEAALAEQRRILGEELRDQKELLSKGLTQAPRVMSLEREAARMDGEAGSLAAEIASSEIRRSEIEIQIARASSERREEAESELRDLRYREMELAERRRGLAERIGRLEIRSPVSGIVHDMRVTTVSSVIRPAEPALFVIPQDRPMVISAKIQTIQVDEVHVGQEAVVRFSSFPMRTTPEVMARVEKVSADAMTDEATRMPYYGIELSVSPEQMSLLGDLQVLPGMPAEIYVKTGDRTPLQYLIKPLSDHFSKAFRES